MVNKYTAKEIPCSDELLELYAKGLTQREIGKKYGVTQRVVLRWFKVLNIETRTPKNLKQSREKNKMWKGNKASYRAFHKRIESVFGKPKECELCGTTDKNKSYDWANLSGRYHDFSDYKRMCRSCHAKFDNKIKNIVGE